MEEAGLTTRIDATGNLIGRREGRETGAPAIILGSHIDTVINGGKFDGTVGVLGGIEVAQCIQDNNISPYHALEVVSFIEEESTRWPISTLGSHAMSGQIDPEKVLLMPDRQGVKLQDALKGVGIDPNNILHAKREPKEIAAYLELHIEQGAVLDNLNLPVGVVTGIAAQVILELTLKGRTDHAGATPMHIRKDALIGAAQIVLEVQKLAIQADPDSVATVGRMEVKPGALNAVPGEVFMTFDIRDIHLETRDNLVRQIVLMIHSIAKINHLELNLIETSRLTPVMLPEKMINTISESCRKLHIPVHIMPSGASHDAQNMAKITDVGMIFIRSKNGISHSPEEFSTMDDISLGTSVLYETVLKLDGEIKV
jgi:allantoate deiminase